MMVKHVPLICTIASVGSMCCAPLLAEVDSQFAAKPFLQQHCIGCHGAEVQESRLRLDRLTSYRVEDETLWTKVHEVLAVGEMPPAEQPQPDLGEVEVILKWIADAQRSAHAGTIRRLNRRELSAALQDLTGLDVDFASGLPDDACLDGFDTGAGGLQDSAASVAQMLNVARRAVDGIRFLEPVRGGHFTADLRAIKDVRKALRSWEERGAKPKTRGYGDLVGLLMEPKWVGDRGGISITVPPPRNNRGILRMKLRVAVQKYRDGLPNPHLWIEVGARRIDHREITRGVDQTPHELIYAVQLDDLAIEESGVTINLASKIEMPYAIEGFENLDKSRPHEEVPGGTGLFRPDFDRKKTPIEAQPVPFVVLQHLEIETDHVASWPPASWLVDQQSTDDMASAKRLIGLWVERAWRRPATEAEQVPFVELYRDLRSADMSFDDALRAAFQAVLMSAPFRYHGSPSDQDQRLAQHAIASRLSFMLAAAPPDAELRKLAMAGQLHDSAVLDQQVDRLLGKTRSEAFARPFVTQWLQLEQPITLVMDHIKKQDFRFGRFLKESMREETIQYVMQLLNQNRLAAELIDSDWTMMNNSLARHYGYKHIKGGSLRRVSLRKDDPRGGGLLSHAGIQSMLCWMGDNWAIYRGAWMLRTLLDDPPPPPPLEVPELDPAAEGNRGRSLRELLQQHQAEANCAVCHKSIDPLGFALQNFDLSGRWREVEYEQYERSELDGKIAWRGVGATRPVDTAGRLPGGEEFTSFEEFKRVLTQSYLDDIVAGMMKRLVLYGTGRKPNVADVAEIRVIMREHRAAGYPLRDMLKAVVRSPMFVR